MKLSKSEFIEIKKLNRVQQQSLAADIKQFGFQPKESFSDAGLMIFYYFPKMIEHIEEMYNVANQPSRFLASAEFVLLGLYQNYRHS